MPFPVSSFSGAENTTPMASAAVPVLAILLVIFAGHCRGQLKVGYYKGKCGLGRGHVDVETIVKTVVALRYINDPTIVPALIRMQFHDCFVHGCDASILLDGPSSEKTAAPNLSLRGFDVIDAIKAAVERVCPGVVSCADIIAMAAREAVFLGGGGRYNVETGRMDGLVSRAANVNLPAPFFSVSQAIAAFANKGLSPTDMVYLLGGHTVGVAHCSAFKDRLYNFRNSGKPDGTMDKNLAIALRLQCPKNATKVDNIVNLDQNPSSSNRVDNSFYVQILRRRGVLQIDQELALDPRTSATVKAIAGGGDFAIKFAEAMVKMGRVQVLTGKQGQIRRQCRAVNK